MNISTVFCDWCCAEGRLFSIACIDMTNPLTPGEGNGWEMRLCADCNRALMRRDFSGLEAREGLHSGMTMVSRQSVRASAVDDGEVFP